MQRADVPCATCGRPTQQNPAEREHGYFWCSKCGRYPDGLSRIEADSDPLAPRSPTGKPPGYSKSAKRSQSDRYPRRRATIGMITEVITTEVD